MRASRFETLKNARKMMFSSWPAQVPSKLPRPSRSILSRAVVNRRGDFPNASLFDKQVNKARGGKAAFRTDERLAPSSRTLFSRMSCSAGVLLCLVSKIFSWSNSPSYFRYIFSGFTPCLLWPKSKILLQASAFTGSTVCRLTSSSRLCCRQS
jgi:hypothetical protein